MTKVALGQPLYKRTERLQQLSLTQTDRKETIKFQRKLQHFYVYTVLVDLPKYRLANGRTQAAQEEFLSKHPDLPSDYFEKDPELEEVQIVQHEILIGMLEEKKLLSYFKDNNQEYPLILTHNGFVVNGNRRLCAMRELLREDSVKYKRFNNVEIIILPPSDERDLVELEAQLQIQPDIRADYSWISRACMFRKRKQVHNFTNAELADLHGIKEKEVEEDLDLLHHVDAYLASRGKPKEYQEVQNDYYAFLQLKKNRPKIKEDTKREIFTELVYRVMDAPRDKGRLYAIIPEIQQYIDPIIERVREEIPIAETVKEDGPKTLFDDFFGEGEPDLENLALTLNKGGFQQEILNVIKDVVEEQSEKSKEQKSKNYALNQVRKANTLLNEALTCLEESSNVQGMQEQLNSIETTVSRLRERLKAYVTN